MNKVFLILLLSFSSFSFLYAQDNIEFDIKGNAASESYGYLNEEPIKVGGGYKGGYHFQFIAHLKGPNGEELEITRIGSCGSYKGLDKKYGNAMITEGVLTCFEINCASFKKPKMIVLDKYRDGELFIPKGLTWKKEVNFREVISKMHWGRKK